MLFFATRLVFALDIHATMPSRYGIALAIVAIIILIWVVGAKRSSAINDYITGAWVAPDEFCEEAELESLMIVFGEPTSSAFGNVEQLGYIVANPNISAGLTMHYSRGFTMSPYERTFVANVEFDDGPLWGDSNPTNVTISVDMVRGSMVIRNDDTIFAELYKSNDVSDLIKGVEADI